MAAKKKRAPRELNDAKCAIRKMTILELSQLCDWIIKERHDLAVLIAVRERPLLTR